MRIGQTTTLPMEVIFASGNVPIDLNNSFVMGESDDYVTNAEKRGFPRNICAWIKGLYTCATREHIDEVVGVVQGDCSNTHSLMSVLAEDGIAVTPFSFPYSHKYDELKLEIERFAEHYNVSMESVYKVKKELDKIRKKLIYLDELTYKENKVTGFENHLWLVNSADFGGDYRKFDRELDLFLEEAKQRKPRKKELRLAYLGVPTIVTDLYSYFEDLGARVVFNEVQRQYAMPYLCEDIVDQYLEFTYPYDITFRLNDIKKELKERKIDAVISYTQSFCHRQIDNIILKKHIDLPILMIEGDRPGPLDERTKLRIESFLEMIE